MRTLLTASLVLGFVVTLFADAAAGEKKPVIGFASREMVNDYNRGIVEGARKVVEGAGGTLVTTDGQADIRKHIDNINSFITRGVDGILVQLGDPEQFASVFAKAKAAGIPVVTTSIGQTAPDALCDVNGDDEIMTAVLMRQLVTDIKAKGKVYIISVPGAPVLETRARIARPFLSGYSGIQLADTVPTQHSVPYTLNVMQNILTANPEPGSVAAVFVTYDLLASGAAMAITNAGRQNEIKVYSIDGDEIGFQMLFDRENPFAATVSQNVENIGAIAAEMILKAVDGKADEIPYAVYPPTALAAKTDMAAAVQIAKDKWGADCMEKWGIDEKALLGK
jgi:ABC-type sugar transport system, periplasmic component